MIKVTVTNGNVKRALVWAVLWLALCATASAQVISVRAIATYPPSGGTLSFASPPPAGDVVAGVILRNGATCVLTDSAATVVTQQIENANSYVGAAAYSYTAPGGITTYTFTGANCSFPNEELVDLACIVSDVPTNTATFTASTGSAVTSSSTAGGLNAGGYTMIAVQGGTAGLVSATVNGNAMTSPAGTVDFAQYLNPGAFASSYTSTANFGISQTEMYGVVVSFTSGGSHCSASPAVPWIGTPLFEEIIHLLG